jgi:hypothetical protein
MLLYVRKARHVVILMPRSKYQVSKVVSAVSMSQYVVSQRPLTRRATTLGHGRGKRLALDC